jgi:hypothetical protein
LTGAGKPKSNRRFTLGAAARLASALRAQLQLWSLSPGVMVPYYKNKGHQPASTERAIPRSHPNWAAADILMLAGKIERGRFFARLRWQLGLDALFHL